MREILFKAKFKGFEWVEGYLLREKDTFGTVTTEIYQIRGNGQFRQCDVDPKTVSEYTGKRDSDGRKIFENDIARVHSYYLNESYIAVVKFGEYGDGFRNNKGNIGFYIEFYCDKNGIFRQDFGYWLEACKVEVIGNIFDNPELVEDYNE